MGGEGGSSEQPKGGDGDAGDDAATGGKKGQSEEATGGKDQGTGGEPMDAHPELEFDSSVLPAARIGQEYEVEIAAMTESETQAWVTVGQLPPGLSLEISDGMARIVGTPEESGNFDFSVLFQGDDGSNLLREYSLRVRTLAWFIYKQDGGCYAVDLTDGLVRTPIPFCDSVVEEAGPPSGFQSSSTGLLSFKTSDEEAIWVNSFAEESPTRPVRVSLPLSSPDGRVLTAGLSSDGRWLAYFRQEDLSPTSSLMLVSLSGPTPGVPRIINEPLPQGGSLGVASFVGPSIVYQAFRPTQSSGEIRLYEFPLGSTSAVATPLTDWDGGSFQPLPDGKQIVFQRARSPYIFDLFVLGLRGQSPTQPVRLHEALSGSDSAGSALTLNKQGDAYYFGIRRTDPQIEAYQAKIDDAGKVETVRLGANLTGPVGRLLPSPDGSSVLLEVKGDLINYSELYVVDVSGKEPGEPRRIDGPHPSGGTPSPIYGGPTWSPDSRYVIYSADSETLGIYNTYAVDVQKDELTPIKLHDAEPDQNTSAGQPLVSPTGEAVVISRNFSSLYRVPEATLLSGEVPGPRLSLGLDLGPTESENGAAWSPDGRWFALVLLDQDTQESRLLLIPFKDDAFGKPVEVASAAPGTALGQFLPSGF